jgi:VanZ family protein
MLATTTGNRAIVWTIATLAVVANIAGYAFNLYDRFWWFDDALHAFTIFALTLVLGLLLYGRTLTGKNSYPGLVAVMIAALGVAIGAWWEIAEWAYDLSVPSNVILGKTDTIIDLIMDTIGALIGGGLATAMARVREDR